MKKNCILIILLLMITFHINALEFKRKDYTGQFYSNVSLDVASWSNNPSFSSFLNTYGFRQIEIYNGHIYEKYYLIDGVIDYALMSFSIFKNNYIKLVDKYIIGPILKNATDKDIILTYFKNDLNVSKTAKDLYINRNSLLNKFESIYKLTGLNLQKFIHACAMYLFVLGMKDIK